MPRTIPTIPLLTIEAYCLKNYLAHDSNSREIVNFLIVQAQVHRATALHIDFNDGYTLINFRINGTLTRIAKLELISGEQLIKAIKSFVGITHASLRTLWSDSVSSSTTSTDKLDIHIIPFHPHESIIIHLAPLQKANPSLTKKPGIQKKIFIWQMGKVGSASILSSLTPLTKPFKWDVTDIATDDHWLRENNIFHTHSTQTLYNFLHQSDEEFIIISLVRDLLSRNISSIFQSMCQKTSWNKNFIATEEEFRNFPYEIQEKQITKKLRALNLEDHLLGWYNNLFKSHFYYPDVDRYHIDVFSKPFKKNIGYQTYDSITPRIKMIIMRLENLDNMADTLGSFLEIENFSLIKENVSSQKWYREVYSKFRSRYTPSQQELDKIYCSDFMRYFYSPEQIENFISTWTDI